MVGFPDQVVDRRQVEVQLADLLRGELADLQLDDHVAAEPEVVEEEIDPEVLTAHLQGMLTPDEGEPDPKLDEKVAEVRQQRSVKVALRCPLSQAQEVEVVGVLEDLPGQIGLGRGKGPVEVCDRLSLTAEEVALDLVDENVPAPPVLHRLANVPLPFGPIFQLVQDHTVMKPRNLCSNLLQKSVIFPRLRKGPHVLEVPRREALHLRKLPAEIDGEPIYHLCAPALFSLALEDRPPHLPVEENKLSIDGKRCTNLSRADSALQIGKQFWISRRRT
ncbi:MAG: hypothetical protein METHAR1v1_1730002 [Methanothrix sp.]|nr:MAG: hypothetical protein METHAR1v1_1730002 [Methanothrix sp.]